MVLGPEFPGRLLLRHRLEAGSPVLGWRRRPRVPQSRHDRPLSQRAAGTTARAGRRPTGRDPAPPRRLGRPAAANGPRKPTGGNRRSGTAACGRHEARPYRSRGRKGNPGVAPRRLQPLLQLRFAPPSARLLRDFIWGRNPIGQVEGPINRWEKRFLTGNGPHRATADLAAAPFSARATAPERRDGRAAAMGFRAPRANDPARAAPPRRPSRERRRPRSAPVHFPCHRVNAIQ